MSTYVIADIHGEYDLFVKMLEKIRFSDSDLLYILGDILDRGPHPIKTMLKVMDMPNVICIVGNHECMALECLEFLMQEITEESIKKLDEDFLEAFINWADINGGRTTMREFQELDRTTQQNVIDFIKEFSVYEELTVGGKQYLLVHAGLGGYYPGKDIEDYTLKELIWDRAEYDVQYYPDIYVVTGHTPTFGIPGNPRPGYIYRENNHIAIDCGCHSHSGRLAAICLDTGEEFYVSKQDTDEDA